MDTATPVFHPYPKTPRLFRDVIVTEKIDGTNAAVVVTEDGDCYAQSRNRVITPEADNAGFAAWVWWHADLLATVLGVGVHYGEWWGSGIQRGYGLTGGEKRLSLFNVHRHADVAGAGIPGLDVVPTLYTGPFSTDAVGVVLEDLERLGSHAAPGFMRPEGVCVYHTAARQVFKALLENDDQPKGGAA